MMLSLLALLWVSLALNFGFLAVITILPVKAVQNLSIYLMTQSFSIISKPAVFLPMVIRPVAVLSGAKTAR